MEQTGRGKLLGAFSALIAAGAAFFSFTVPLGMWNYSAEGGSLLIGTVGGALAAILGLMSRKTGGVLSLLGLILGVAAFAVGAYLLLVGGTPVEFG